MNESLAEVNWPLAASVVVGVLLVVAAWLVADRTGLTGPTAFAVPLLVGVVVAAGIRLRFGA